MVSVSVNTSDPASNSQVGRFMVAAGAVVEHPATSTILLVKRGDVDYKSGIWEIGYGRLEQGEDPTTGLQRELQEETGLAVTPKEILTTWFYNRGKKQQPKNQVIGITYWVISNSRSVELSAEHAEYQWVTPEKALEIVTEKQVKRDIQAFMVAKKQATARQAAEEKYQRALADYHNLVRRTKEERSSQSKLATRRLIEDLLQPLEHLSLAAEELDDEGLNMVIAQLWEALSQHGLEEIDALGQPFNIDTMEAVERDGDGETVTEVRRRGYKLYDTVIQHAKVVLGSQD